MALVADLNTSSLKTRSRFTRVFNTIAANDLATQGAEPSVEMVVIYCACDSQITKPYGLKQVLNERFSNAFWAELYGHLSWHILHW